MKHSALALVALAAGLALAFTSSTAATKTVKVGDNFYSPKSVSIKVDDKVSFKWQNTRKRHNVKRLSGPSFSGSKTKRGSYVFTKTFTKRGTWKLYCTIHPDSMRVTVKVAR